MRLSLAVAVVVGITILMLWNGRQRPGQPGAQNGSSTTAQPDVVTSPFARSTARQVAAVLDKSERVPATGGSNVFERLASGELDLSLNSEQVAEYLRQYGTNVETLLATQMKDYIRLAAEMFPDDPRVQYAVLTRELFPEARREWLDRFKSSAPENAMADYLSAREYLKAGDREKGLADLANAMTKPGFNDYSAEQLQNMEESHLSAGRSVAEAKAASFCHFLLPQLQMLRGLGQDVQKMQQEYVAAGDSASAAMLAQYTQPLAQQLMSGEGSRSLINQLVGAAIERGVLKELPADSQPDFLGGLTVQQRLDALTEFRNSVRPLTPLAEQLLQRGNEMEIVSYFDRMKSQGEYKALLWLQNRERLRQR